MRTVKQLDLFLLKTFLPLFIMTFGICLFIFLMQFLWMYIDEMVGKGIEILILVELFFYAAMKFVPSALPLAILFASLMTFGNLGEQYELLAMKASGISLMRIMKPVIVFLVFISISAFFFQNDVIPVSQVKMYTILNSVKQKSPEMEIPENIFYSMIPGKNILVKAKDKKTGLLKDIMIYDYSAGFNDIRVTIADSGRLKTSTDKKFLIMTLYNGESFDNLKGGNQRAREAKDAVPYQRESFEMMEMLIEFDGNFNMSNEAMFSNRYISKDIASLRQSIDSMTVELDSIREVESKSLFAQSYRRTLAGGRPPLTSQDERSLGSGDNTAADGDNNSGVDATKKNTMNFDSLYRVQQPNIKASLLSYSKRYIENLQMNYNFKSLNMKFEGKEIRLHHTEMHKKFTLSFACLIFFFIGAPLGAIIRKGGLGMPAVISVFLFIVYYIIENIGYKMARDGVWEPWQGMWLSSAVLLPLGVFLTYKAVNDSVILNAETYIESVMRLIGKRVYRKVEKKEVIMEVPDYSAVDIRLNKLVDVCKVYLANNKRWLNYITFWKLNGIDKEAETIAKELESIVEILENSDQNLVLNKTMDFPVINSYNLANFQISRKVGIAMAVFFPVGVLVYLVAIYRRKLLHRDIITTMKVSDEMINVIKELRIKN